MPLPIENLTAAERAAARDKQRRSLAGLPSSRQESAFLSNEARVLADIQFQLEDTLIALAAVVPVPGEANPCGVAADTLRQLLPEHAAAVARLQVAAQYDISSVQDSQASEEPPSGMSAAQYKAVRTTFRQREEAAKKALEEAARSKNRRTSAGLAAAHAALALSGPAASSPYAAPLLPTPVQAGYAATAAHQAAPYQQSGFLPPQLPQGYNIAPPAAMASAMGPRLPARMRFPCDACGVKGHWREDGLCKADDVRRHIQTLTLRLQQEQLALPAPAPEPSGRTLY
jgi:hypothetical protein